VREKIQILTELDYAAMAKNGKRKEQRLLNTFKYSLTKILPGDKAADDIKIISGKFIEGEFKRSTVNLKIRSLCISCLDTYSKRAISYGRKLFLG
jgi:Na+-transporting NADH:ubiquinone oxidoreductase subunit NqrA